MNNTFVNIINDSINNLKSLYTDKSVRPYFLISLGLHLLVGILLVVNFANNSQPQNLLVAQAKKQNTEKIIKAVAIDEKQVEQEVARLNKLDEHKENKIKQEEERLVKLKKQKELESKKLVEEQKKLAKLEEEKKLEAKKLQELALKQEQEAKKLEKIKEENIKQEKLEAQKLKEKQEIQEKLEKAEKIAADKKAKELAQKQAEEKKKELLKEKQEALLKKLKDEQEKSLLSNLDEEEERLESDRIRQRAMQNEINRIIGLQQAKVSRNWLSNDNFLGRDLSTKLEIKLDESGRVLAVKIVKSSGDEALDISAKNAILKSSPLPMPNKQELLKKFTNYVFIFRPDNLG